MELLAFLLAVLVVTAARSGARPRGGSYVWALLAGRGLAALVAASEVAFLVLRVVGAVVLVGLNPKAAVFVLALSTQFVPPGAQL